MACKNVTNRKYITTIIRAINWILLFCIFPIFCKIFHKQHVFIISRVIYCSSNGRMLLKCLLRIVVRVANVLIKAIAHIWLTGSAFRSGRHCSFLSSLPLPPPRKESYMGLPKPLTTSEHPRNVVVRKVAWEWMR